VRGCLKSITVGRFALQPRAIRHHHLIRILAASRPLNLPSGHVSGEISSLLTLYRRLGINISVSAGALG